ncbi:hypothetical protein ABZY30_25315 [Streptomyces massasporeus]|uniref:hypothetical protein n=1 Tax=Streptomyces massasporeus TaxID=67324 RepID=UPI0033ACDE42
MPVHPADTAPSHRPTAVARLSATKGWQNTGFTVEEGETYTVSYLSGTWTVDHRTFPRVGADGYAASVDSRIHQGCKLNDRSPYGSLYLAEGTGDAALPVAQGEILHASRAGSVHLRINDVDRCLADNAGSVRVKLSRGIPATALTDPFRDDSGAREVPYRVVQGYHNKEGRCVIGRGPDHCANQLFSVDLEPTERAVSANVHSPTPGTVRWRDEETGCLGMEQADGMNLTVCHMSSFAVARGASVQRNEVLGVRRTPWLHLSVDDRTADRPFRPVPLTATPSGWDHTLDGASLTPGHKDGTGGSEAVQWGGHSYRVRYEEWEGLEGP